VPWFQYGSNFVGVGRLEGGQIRVSPF